MSWPAGERDPWSWHRPSGWSPLCRFETTGQPQYPAAGSNQVGCGCAWQWSLFLETNTRTTKEIQPLTRAEEVVTTRFRIGHTKAHILSRGPLTICHHCGQILAIDHVLLECAVLRERRDKYYTTDSLNTLFETIPETCIVGFLWEAGFLYLIISNNSDSSKLQADVHRMCAWTALLYCKGHFQSTICWRPVNLFSWAFPAHHRHLQQAVNSIQEWVTRNGFRFAAEKCKVIYFTAPESGFRDPPLTVRIGNTPLPVE